MRAELQQSVEAVINIAGQSATCCPSFGLDALSISSLNDAHIEPTGSRMANTASDNNSTITLIIMFCSLSLSLERVALGLFRIRVVRLEIVAKTGVLAADYLR